jgi:hypothetical protein
MNACVMPRNVVSPVTVEQKRIKRVPKFYFRIKINCNKDSFEFQEFAIEFALEVVED